MSSKAKFLGHPIHQILIVVPLGMLLIAIIFDVFYIISQDGTFALVAFYDIAAGIIGGLLASLFGFIDWREIPGNTRAKRIGRLHGIGNIVVLVLFALSWLLRANDSLHLPTLAAFVLALLGVSLSGLTGWMGGELVDRLGVGVDADAHLNAPSSLSR
jgi:uncharacterized membrane protein